MANRPTAKFGTGGSGGATRTPTAYILPARRAGLPRNAANDNRQPLARRLKRLALYAVIAALILALALI